MVEAGQDYMQRRSKYQMIDMQVANVIVKEKSIAKF